MFTVYEVSGQLGTEFPDYRVAESDAPVTWNVIKSGFETRQAAWNWVKENATE
jgi:phage-related protein